MSDDRRLTEVLDWLERRGTERNRAGMARYGIVSPKVFGVSMATMRPLAKRLGHDHALALALWESGWLEARLLAVLIEEPARVTSRQMDRWARDFDNWALCDTTCMHCFDRTPFAWQKVKVWSGRRGEFVRRAAFALIASLAVHDKRCPDAHFESALRLIDAGARDERALVRKAVSWALRSIGKRNRVLHAEALAMARSLLSSGDPGARWVGKDATRELSSEAVRRRMDRRR